MELQADAARNAEQFLQSKLIELKQRVEQAEARLNAYRREHGVIAFSLDENGKGRMLEQRLGDLNNALARVEAERIALEAQHDLIRAGEADSLPAVMHNQLIQNLRQQSSELAVQYAAMSNQFNTGYQGLDDLKAKLDQSQRQLAQEIGRVAKEVESAYRATIARQQMLEQEISSIKSQALALNDASLQDAMLAREVDASRYLYKSVVERMREIDVSADAPSSGVSVLDRAAPPRYPSSPRTALSLGLGAIGGLGGGIGLAFLLEFLDDRLRTPEQVEQELILPSLALVPDLAKLNSNGNHRWPLSQRTSKLAITSGNGRVSDISVNHGLLVTASKPLSAEAEIYHSICTAISFSQAGQSPRSIVITSAVEGEGKTTTALNVAISFAKSGRKVLLIDADLRRPQCHKFLGVVGRAGLTDVLAGHKKVDDAIHKLPTGLFFLAAGSDCPNPAALIGSRTMREFVVRLSEEYDRVLIDAPPIMPVSDAVVLSTMTDGILLVAGAATSKRIVRQACGRLRHVGANIFGVVLNRMDTSAPDYYLYNPYSYYTRNTESA
jgi:capsular exopolysaccharide synthesis family protein